MSTSQTYQPEWIHEDFVDFVAERFNPIWAWKKVKASMVKKTALSQDFYRLQLRPNRNFQAQRFKAGQSVLVTVVIEGVRQQRSYSIVDILPNGDVIIAIRAQGKVSRYLSSMPYHQVIELSQPQGEFVLEDTTAPILLLASGSGITAIYSLLKQALELNCPKVSLIYFHRDHAFHVELQHLAQQYSQFDYCSIHTQLNKQHLSQALLQQWVPDFQERTTYACGAAAMMQQSQKIYAELGLSDQLKQEYFQFSVDEDLEQQPVTFLRSQQQFDAKTNLLESAEQAGLKPTHGCRMGICNTCTCTKVSGSTKNILTGEIDHDSNTQIKLCISQAISPVVINL